ncbi:MAG: hypothetical protein H8E84_03815 [Flavobacteriales bacterium]|nr:hypothetical protein [Flavobacteriales bacterium]
MQINVIKNINDFNAIKPQWDDLYSSSNFTVFQSFEFNYYAWKNELSTIKNTKLAIVVVKKKDKLKSIFPFYIDNKKQLRFINDIHSDFCDYISIEKIDLNLIFKYLQNELSFNVIQLINLKANSLMYSNFEKNQPLILSQPLEKYSVVHLSKGVFPENYQELKSKQKTGFRRVHKKNKNKTHLILKVAQAPFPKEDIILLKQNMISLGFRNKNFLPENQINLIENLYNSKKIMISVIKSTNKINAISLVLEKENEYLFWIDMFDDSKMVNIFNYISLMQKLSAMNPVVMNLGRGLYNYKTSNFKPSIKQLFAIYIFSNKLEKIKFQLRNRIIAILKPIYKKIKG